MKVTLEPADIGRLEAAADALARAGELEQAVNVWALVLRFRAETHTKPQPHNVVPLRRREITEESNPDEYAYLRWLTKAEADPDYTEEENDD